MDATYKGDGNTPVTLTPVVDFGVRIPPDMDGFSVPHGQLSRETPVPAPLHDSNTSKAGCFFELRPPCPDGPPLLPPARSTIQDTDRRRTVLEPHR